MRIRVYLFSIAAGILVFTSCKNKPAKPKDTIASTPQQLQVKATDLIRAYMAEATSNNGKFSDSTLLFQSRLTELVYEKNEFVPAWCKEENWLPAGDSLFDMIGKARLYGLFPEDYHVKDLAGIRERFYNDSLTKGDRKDASLWARADMLLTDAFIQMIQDIKLGRLPQDSITLRKDSVLTDSFYISRFILVQQSTPVSQIMQSLEPRHRGYHALKKGIPKFLDSADHREFTNVPAGIRD